MVKNKAINQLNKYTQNTWAKRPDVKLSVGNSTYMADTFTMHGKYADLFVKYYCIGHGIIKYEYEREINKQQITKDVEAVTHGVVTGILVIGGAIYVIVVGGATGVLADASVNASALGINLKNGETLISMDKWVA